MWYIQLKDCAFLARHGVYPQEKKLGNRFLVNIKLGFEGDFISEMHQTIDYELVYDIAKKCMDTPRPLLEEVISIIAKELKEQLPNVIYTYISIQKKNPLFGKQIGATEVIFENNYSGNA
jgi:7,8-dihydroneopterin aldolase/epimerase/oxygenase